MLRNALECLWRVAEDCDTEALTMSPIGYVCAMVEQSAIGYFHAVSPKATRGALALVEHHARCKRPRVGDDGIQPQQPSILLPHCILSNLIIIQVFRNHVAIHVKSNASESGPHLNDCHIVLLRDLRYENGKIVLTPWSETMSGAKPSAVVEGEAHCDCKSFEFQSSEEQLCKHIVIAALAAMLRLAPIEHVTEETFLRGIQTGVPIKDS